jgi:hypothetical protein
MRQERTVQASLFDLAEKGRLNVPNRPQRPVLRAEVTEMSGYF